MALRFALWPEAQGRGLAKEAAFAALRFGHRAGGVVSDHWGGARKQPWFADGSGCDRHARGQYFRTVRLHDAAVQKRATVGRHRSIVQTTIPGCQTALRSRKFRRSRDPERTRPMNGAESLVHTLLKSGVDTCFCNPGTSEMHFVAALDRVPGMRCILGLFEGVVTGCGRRLRAHVGQAGGDAAALRAGPRQRTRQPAQRAARADADRQHRRRPGDLPPPERRAADRRHRGLGARRLGLGAHRHHVRHGGRRCRRRGAGGAHPSRTDRHADPAVGHLVGRGRRDRRGAAGAAEAALRPRPGRATPPTSCAAACPR